MNRKIANVIITIMTCVVVMSSCSSSQEALGNGLYSYKDKATNLIGVKNKSGDIIIPAYAKDVFAQADVIVCYSTDDKGMVYKTDGEPLFYEEFDWSRRMRDVGYRLFYEPRAVIYHKESVTIVKRSPLRTYYLFRSRVMYARRNSAGIARCLSCLYLLCVVMPFKMGRHIKEKRWDLAKAVWRGTWSGLRVRMN